MHLKKGEGRQNGSLTGRLGMPLQVPNRTLAAAKEGAAKATVDVLNSYRKNCSGQSAPGQLVLPEALKLAPLYNLSLSKCPAFRYLLD